MRTISFLLLLSVFCFGALCSAAVSANISVKSIHGSAGIIGYRTVNDTVTLNLTSTTNNISIFGILENGCNCINMSGFFCTCTFTDSQDIASFDYSISNGIDNAKATIKVDNSIGNIDYSINTYNGNATLSYSITDTGYNMNDACTGIASIDVYADQDNINSISFNTTPGHCQSNGSVILNTDSGSKIFYIKATDNAGNSKESLKKNISIDVSAPEISNLQILSYGNPVDTASPNAQIPIDVSFDVAENNLISISVDLSSINNEFLLKNSYKKILIPISTCTLNSSADLKLYTCTIKNKIMELGDSQNSINVTITANDSYANTITTSLVKTFVIDGSKPTATITTDYCDSKGKCFVKNGVNKINVNLDKQNFVNKRIFFSINDIPFQVTNCTSGTCFGYALVNCNSGEELKAGINPQSMDDAGNIVNFNPAVFKCDNTPPKILSAIFTGSNTDLQFKDLIMSKSKVIMNVLIKESESDELVNSTVDLGEMKNATEKSTSCQKDFALGILNCTWTIMNINDGYYNASLTFNVTDVMGNSDSKVFHVFVLGLQDNSTPDDLKIQFSKVIPSSIDRISVDLANSNKLPYFVYAQYQLYAKKSNVQTVLLYQKINNCVYKNVDTGEFFSTQIFSAMKIADEYANVSQTNRIDFLFDNTLKINDLPDSFVAYCNISAFIREGTIVYNTPQYLTLEVPFEMRNSQLGTPGQMFQDKIKREKDGFLYNMQLLGTLNSVLPKIQKICDFRNYLDMASYAGTILNIAASTITPAFSPAGMKQGTMSFAINIQSIANCFNGDPATQGQGIQNQKFGQQEATVQGTASDQQGTTARFGGVIGACNNIVRTTCDFLSCQVAEKFEDKNTGPITNLFSNDTLEKGVLKNVNTPDLKNSLYYSLKTECWPAVIYNFNKIRQVDCSYVYCLEQTSLHGTDISVCDKAKRIQICSLVAGEVFELPGIRIGKNIINNIGELINSVGPLSAVSVAKMTYCGEYLDPNMKVPLADKLDTTKIYLCQVPLQIARFIDGMKRSTRAATFIYPEITDMCELAQNPSMDPNSNSFWKTMNNVQLPNSVTDKRDYAFIKSQTDIYDKAKKDRSEALSSLSDSGKKFYAGMSPGYVTQSAGILQGKAPDTFLQSGSINKANPNPEVQPLADAQLVLSPTTFSDGLKKVILNEVAMDNADNLIRCGNKACLDALNQNLNLKMTPEQFDKLDEQTKAVYLSKYNTIYAQAVTNIESTTNIINADTKALAGQPSGSQTDIATRAQIEQQKNLRDKSLKDIGMCNGADGKVIPSGHCPDLTDTQYKDLASTNKFYQARAQAQEMGNGIYILLQLLYQNHVLDFMMTANWGSDALKVVDYFNTDKWKDNLCNPDVSVLGGADENSGTAITCDSSGNCQPVLTMAAERQEFVTANNTHYYLYTVAYYLGPVGMNKDKTMPYNVYFTGDGVTVKGYIKTKQALQPNQVVNVAKAFAHYKKLDKICIKFDNDVYPPNVIGGKNEYCRTIKDSNLGGDFNTGSPAIDLNNPAYGYTTVTNTPAIIYTGKPAALEPGVFE